MHFEGKSRIIFVCISHFLIWCMLLSSSDDGIVTGMVVAATAVIKCMDTAYDEWSSQALYIYLSSDLNTTNNQHPFSFILFFFPICILLYSPPPSP